MRRSAPRVQFARILAWSAAATWLAAAGCNSDLTKQVGVPSENTIVTIQALAGSVSGAQVRITYFLYNERGFETGRTEDLTVEYRVAGATDFQSATRNGGEATTGLAVSDVQPGATHTFTWNSTADVPDQDTTVTLRITPDLGSAAAITLDLQNANVATVVTIDDPGAAVSGTQVAIGYSLQNARAQAVDVTVEYRVEGALDFAPATRNGGEGTTNLTTAVDAPGAAHTFNWNSLTDVGENDRVVTLRVTPPLGDPATLDLTVMNAPVGADAAIVTQPAASDGGIIEIGYTLTADPPGLTSVLVEYAVGDGDFATATSAGCDDGTSGLEADATGSTTYRFRWDSLADIDANTLDVRLRVTPTGRDGTLTNAFTLNNGTFAPTLVDLIEAQYVFPVPNQQFVLNCVLDNQQMTPVGQFSFTPTQLLDLLVLNFEGDTCLDTQPGASTIAVDFPFAGATDVPAGLTTTSTTLALASPAALTPSFTIGDFAGDPNFSVDLPGFPDTKLAGCIPTFEYTTSAMTFAVDRTVTPPLVGMNGTIDLKLRITRNPNDPPDPDTERCGYPGAIAASVCTISGVPLSGAPGTPLAIP